ncbi:MAG: hypothetical protein JWP91_426 [Fibrobacteres bacterium]|nr:hypothetical protein [Fibrobacterota bacterium]
MTTAPMHEVKSAAAVLADDVICQSFIQSSSTLAYACLLIRQGKYDLALHVLHSLEAKQASRFKDMVFYLQAQIGIETGEFATVKKRLVPRVHQHPNDMVALSLLECDIYLEFVEWEKSHPRPDASGTFEVATPSGSGPILSDSYFGNTQAASASASAARFEASHRDTPPSMPQVQPESRPQPPSAVDPRQADTPLSGLAKVKTAPPLAGPMAVKPAKTAPPSSAPAAPAAPRVPYPASPGASQEGAFGIFQALSEDKNTQALAIWNPEKGKFKSECRDPVLETLVAMLPHEVPMPIQAACASLEGGTVNKICFSFQNMTVTSFHSGGENMGLITGNINQSLLTIVRAENTFRKHAASQAQSAASAAGRPAEYSPNE